MLYYKNNQNYKCFVGNFFIKDFQCGLVEAFPLIKTTCSRIIESIFPYYGITPHNGTNVPAQIF